MLKKFLNFDFIYFAGILLLLAVGLIALYSVFSDSNSIFWRQLLFTGIGIGIFIFLGLIDYSIFRSYSTWFYFFSIGILIIVLFFGKEVSGTVGWLDLGFVVIQPVEIVKVCLIIFLAHFIEDKRIVLGELTTIVSSFILVSIIGFLILKQPDLGSALVVYGIWLGMIFISGIRKRYLFSFIIFGIMILLITWPFLPSQQQGRITGFFNQSEDLQGSGYHVNQSIIAIGNGGLNGQGIGYGSQSQLNFLPEKHTDFIFATIVETTGFIGAIFILGLFLLIFIRFRSIAQSSRDSFGYFLVSGVMTMFFIHILINIGMNMGVMPVTGIPLPFISYGGSSLISVLIISGIVMNVYVRRESTLGKVVTDY
ncbi:MAG: rod shape-determining protein RodA [Candidatus Moranbacteria bacterium]|nr:rod shape-determining protein RodA [Candidatus Moranbacteria bacterium]